MGLGWRGRGALQFLASPSLCSLQLISWGSSGQGSGMARICTPWPKKSPRCPPILTKSFCTGSWGFPAGKVLAGLLEGEAAAPRIALRSRCPTPRRARRFTDFLSF